MHNLSLSSVASGSYRQTLAKEQMHIFVAVVCESKARVYGILFIQSRAIYNDVPAPGWFSGENQEVQGHIGLGYIYL